MSPRPMPGHTELVDAVRLVAGALERLTELIATTEGLDPEIVAAGRAARLTLGNPVVMKCRPVRRRRL